MTKPKGFDRHPAVTLLAPLFITLFSALPVSAQVELNRISSVERSDGLGYVVRYHLSQPVDSFIVHQPEIDLIQMKLYADELDTTGLQLPTSSQSIQEVRYY
ncbi:MAG: hypothetical protein WD317_04060, partial [Balneolaceae bacterium]